MKRHTFSVTVGNETLHFETGKIARQANGSVIVRAGDTMVFSAVTAAKQPDANVDFLPLRVDYQEKFSSAGKTLGGFIKREGRPSQKEILVSRLIDRPLRPMFPDGYFTEVQVLTYVWSYDGVNAPEPLAICASAAALTISDVPLIKPVAAVRVGLIGGKYVLNPTVKEQEDSILDLLIAGTEDAVLMIEGDCNFLTEDQVLTAIETGHNGIRTICHALQKWREEIGREKETSTIRPLSKECLHSVEEIAQPLLVAALKITDKKAREEALAEIKTKLNDKLFPEGVETPRFSSLDVQRAYKKVSSDYMRRMILKDGIRSDGRTTTQIRQIDIEQAILPRTHGSSLFTRGETQALAVCTLGGEGMAQRFEDLHGNNSFRFYLQYFFPPFSVGEVGRSGPAGRREVGHGKLAERALIPLLPPKEEFPYTIRIESNITESNGSSSMATVCGGCLAMMDAGVPIKRPIAGIAMGLILEADAHTILSDILGIEDALGDMDFKVAGDKEGITSFQMDIKVEGITLEIMRTALAQARDGRIHILNKMLEVCPTFKSDLSAYAPRIETIKIKPSKIATVIGPGGKQIRAIVEETGVEIDIDDNGLVSITSSDLASLKKARSIIEGLTADVEIGRIYEGRIASVVAFGVFVEVLPGKEGLCHISEFDKNRIENMADVAKEGDIVSVKVIDINERGQLKLSRKATLA